jgi:hypothetical protein
MAAQKAKLRSALQGTEGWLGRGLRGVAARIPPAARERIDAQRNRLTMRRIAPANARFVAEHGLVVSGGPFRGMRYLPGLEASQGDLVTKLLGSYEHELHAAVAAWPGSGLALAVNVGCAEGYYAVGLALADPTLKVLAYDVDPQARRLCAALAALNLVADRVQVHGWCDPATLAALPERGVGLFVDCEGYELTLLDPAAAPVLRHWSILVELHDFVDPTITETICARFADSHEIELIESTPRSVDAPELSALAPRTRRLVLDERPVAMRWASLTPRG